MKLNRRMHLYWFAADSRVIARHQLDQLNPTMNTRTQSRRSTRDNALQELTSLNLKLAASFVSNKVTIGESRLYLTLVIETGKANFNIVSRRHLVAAVAEWYRYRIVACLATSSNPVPLKTCRVGQRSTLNLSRAETRPPVNVVVRRGGASSGVVHVT
ncbi:uncharacterized protein TNCV_5047211 [Trichonephila clavipes]|nr:uncharacterized protein TNCV_5047211 [Trichonephila clavipes]